jgi:hypothetical protein
MNGEQQTEPTPGQRAVALALLLGALALLAVSLVVTRGEREANDER